MDCRASMADTNGPFAGRALIRIRRLAPDVYKDRLLPELNIALIVNSQDGYWRTALG